MSLLNKIILYCSLGCTLLIAGCSTWEDQVDWLSYDVARQEPEARKGGPIRWTGIIADTRVLASGTDVEIVLLPLDYTGQPLQRHSSPGRFIAHFEQMLDPVLYAKGLSILVQGSFQGMQLGKIGEQDYRFPLVRVDQHKLWPPHQDVEVRYWHDPYYSDGPYPYRRRHLAPPDWP